jgi:hypothetical protein
MPNLPKLELANGSRIVGLPGREATIRSFSGVTLLVVDEASKVADDLYRSVRPMLAVSNGRLVLMSTPFGRRGFFHHEWEHGGDKFRRFQVPWEQCPRISAEFMAEEEASLGRSWVDQEYRCLFTALEGLVLRQLAGRGVARLRLLRQRLEDDRLQLRRDRRLQPTPRRRVLAHHLPQQHLAVLGSERRPQRQQLVQRVHADTPQREPTP